VLLDRTPFYAESGGQVGDTGLLAAGPSGALVQVRDVQKAAGGRLFVHAATVASGALRVGEAVTARVDEATRRRVRAHHTATHLLQSALKRVLGPDTCQQGSLVNAERLRFDFNLGRPMTPDEVAAVEGLVNGWVADASPAVTRVMALNEARASGATAMFGEKYDDVVRVVDVPGVSMELCGGARPGPGAVEGGGCGDAEAGRRDSRREGAKRGPLPSSNPHPCAQPHPTLPLSQARTSPTRRRSARSRWCLRAASPAACAASRRWRGRRRWSTWHRSTPSCGS
jgi:alanyl-tRNA synthetase